MIKSISLKNFKIFKKEVNFELSKLNLLTGINGRGKSSFLQSILILRQSLEKQEKLEKILFNGFCVNIGTFSDVKNKNISIEEDIVFSISFVDKSKIEIKIKQSDKDNMVGDIKNKDNLSKLQVFKNIHYIAADRIGPQEFYIKSTLPDFINVGTRGEFVGNVLLQKKEYSVNEDIAIREKKEHDITVSLALDLEIQTGEWLSKILDADTKVFVKNEGNKRIISILFQIDKQKDLIPTNVGFGYSYILPIVVSGLIAQKGEVLIVENPEAHLHPKAQHELILFLAKVAKTGVQVFIETHSEHILNAVRIATLKKYGILNKKEISILYFQNNDSELVVKIPLLENGTIEEWPDNFFDQTEKDFNKLFEFE